MLQKIFLIFILIITNLLGKDAIKLEVPPYSNSPVHTGIKIKFEESMKKGDKVIVNIYNQQAFELINNSSNPIKYIKTYIRLFSSNMEHPINVKLIKNNGNIITASTKIQCSYGGRRIELYGEPTNRLKVKQKENNAKLIIENEMHRVNYIDMVKIKSSQGDITIKTTPLLSDRLLFKIRAKNDFDKLTVTAHISDKIYTVGLNSSEKNVLKKYKNKKIKK
ncbi:MAG: hypothetical protein DSZ06_00970 [Sulfurospirillum sp.]|nr:MAG: hypothetical protein DSZ06_00970 [Sulfurospirillum sp.]